MEEEIQYNPAPGMQPSMTPNKEIRAAALATLKGRWTNPVLCTLVYMLISGVVSAVAGSNQSVIAFIGVLLTLLVVVPLDFGYSVAFLRHVRGDADDDLVTRPFDAFKDYGRYLGTSLLYSLFVVLWTLLLIVPGIIMGLAYAMTPYIMLDHPELSPMECIKKSKAMMQGHKWQLFCLGLSFIGWMLLGIITLGIGMLWVTPYMQCSFAKFYEELKAKEQ